MSKKIATAVMAAALAVASGIPAYAGPRGHDHGDHARMYRDGGHRHHGRGHWHNGKWIALGILGAAAAAAAADREDCYYRRGDRVCDY